MDPTQAGMYGLVQALFSVLFTGQVAILVWPTALFLLILRIIAWMMAIGRGEREETLRNDLSDTFIHRRITQGNAPSPARRSGYRRRG